MDHSSKIDPVCSRCLSDLAMSPEMAECTSCGVSYPRLGSAVNFAAALTDREKHKQQAIYEGREDAGVDLAYLERAQYRRNLEEALRNIDTIGLTPMTMKGVMNRIMMDRAGFRPGMEVLDIGSGSGVLLNSLARRYQVRGTGIDLSALAVQRSLEFNPHGLTFHMADAENLPFPDGSFERVVSFDVLEHVIHQKKLLEEAYRVTAKGGAILFYAISAAEDYTWHWLQRKVSGGKVGHQHGGGHSPELFLDPETVVRWLEDIGFSKVKLVPFHSFFTLLADERLRDFLQPPHLSLRRYMAVFRLFLWADYSISSFGFSNAFYIMAEKG